MSYKILKQQQQLPICLIKLILDFKGNPFNKIRHEFYRLLTLFEIDNRRDLNYIYPVKFPRVLWRYYS